MSRYSSVINNALYAWHSH